MVSFTPDKTQPSVEHVEHPISTTHADTDAEAVKTLPSAFGAIDAETAKYLNPDIVIDEATNRRIKGMVCNSLYRADDSSTGVFCLS